MSEERFIYLLNKKMGGSAAPVELDELETLISSSPILNKLYQEISGQGKEPSEVEVVEAEQAYSLHLAKLQLHLQSRQEEAEPVRFYPLYKRFLPLIAAGIAIVTALSIIWFLNAKNTHPENRVATTRGSKTNITLPDGTKVWLNSESELKYASSFGGKNREVYLSGEAFFDIIHDASKPFIIHTDKITIKDLGTAFNVKCYPKDSLIETSLIRGKVSITLNERPNEQIGLLPNEKLVVRRFSAGSSTALTKESEVKVKLENLIPIGRDNLVAETAWTENKIAFNNKSMGEISKILERRFDIKVTYRNNAIINYRYTATFEDESLNDILSILQTSKPFNYEINGKNLIIY